MFDITEQMKRLSNEFFQTKSSVRFRKINNNEGFQNIEAFPNDTETFNQFFPHTEVGSKNSNKSQFTKVHVMIKLTSLKSFQELKADKVFYSYLVENRIYLIAPNLTDLDIVSVRFLTGQSPQLVWREDLEKKLQGKIVEEALAIHKGIYDSDEMVDINDVYVPQIEVSNRKITHVDKDTKMKFITVAMDIKCNKKDATQVKEFLMMANLEDIGTFVPYGIQGGYNRVYTQQIQFQNQFLHSIRMIPMFGIPREVMEAEVPQYKDFKNFKDFLENITNKLTGERILHSIEATQRTDDLGKWLFTFHSENMNEVHEFLDGAFQEYFADVKDNGGFSMLPDFPLPRKAGAELRSKMADYALQLDALSDASTYSLSANSSITTQRPPAARNRPVNISYRGLNHGDFPPLIRTKQKKAPNPWRDREPRHVSQESQKDQDAASISSAETTTLSNTASNVSLRRFEDMQAQLDDMKKRLEEQESKMDKTLDAFDRAKQMFDSMVTQQNELITEMKKQTSDREFYMREFSELKLQLAAIIGTQRATTDETQADDAKSVAVQMEIDQLEREQELEKKQNEWKEVGRNVSPRRTATTHQLTPQKQPSSATRPSKLRRSSPDENMYSPLTAQAPTTTPQISNGRRRGVNMSKQYYARTDRAENNEQSYQEPRKINFKTVQQETPIATSIPDNGPSASPES